MRKVEFQKCCATDSDLQTSGVHGVDGFSLDLEDVREQSTGYVG